jgi:hypothetical protein
MSTIVRAMAPPRIRTRRATDVIAAPDAANSPNTKSHTGMIAARLNTVNISTHSKKTCSPPGGVYSNIELALVAIEGPG